MSSVNVNNNQKNPPIEGGGEQPNKNTFVSITGAALKCEKHGIETFDLDEWNAHCAIPENEHFENGDVPCVDCGALLTLVDYPYVPLTPKGKEFNIRCDNCINKLIQQSQTLRGVNPK